MAKVVEKSLEQDIRAIIAEITEVEPGKITLEADFVNDLGMDSMMALEILAAIEKKFKIQIPEDKLMKIINLKEVLNLASDFLAKK